MCQVKGSTPGSVSWLIVHTVTTVADSTAPSASREWYAQGLRFQCTQCGNCCTGPPGTVWFASEDARAIAESLGVDEAAFYERYARKVDRRWSLTEHKTAHGYDCVFLDRESDPGKALCSIYKARPAQCRTWPFWPENLRSRRSWEDTKRATPCPGMNSGNLIPIEKIRILRDSTPR